MTEEKKPDNAQRKKTTTKAGKKRVYPRQRGRGCVNCGDNNSI